MRKLRKNWKICLAGCVGAAAPEIVRIYKIVTAGDVAILPNFGPSYFLISILFILLGGIVAIVLDSPHPANAFFVGVTLPIIISSALQMSSPGLIRWSWIEKPISEKKISISQILDVSRYWIEVDEDFSDVEKQKFLEKINQIESVFETMYFPLELDPVWFDSLRLESRPTKQLPFLLKVRMYISVLFAH